MFFRGRAVSMVPYHMYDGPTRRSRQNFTGVCKKVLLETL